MEPSLRQQHINSKTLPRLVQNANPTFEKSLRAHRDQISRELPKIQNLNRLLLPGLKNCQYRGLHSLRNKTSFKVYQKSPRLTRRDSFENLLSNFANKPIMLKRRNNLSHRVQSQQIDSLNPPVVPTVVIIRKHRKTSI